MTKCDVGTGEEQHNCHRYDGRALVFVRFASLFSEKHHTELPARLPVRVVHNVRHQSSCLLSKRYVDL